jgi:ABC-2 type transport system permease protein
MNKAPLLILLRAYSHGMSFWDQFKIFNPKKKSNKTAFARLTHAASLVFIVAALLSAGGSMMYLLGINYLQIQAIGEMTGHQDLVMFFAGLMGFVLTLVFATMTAGSTLYRGKDLPLLMTLPITERQLFISRLCLHYSANAPLFWVALIPGIVVTFMKQGISSAMVFSSVLILLVGPLAPLAISIIFTHLAVRFGRIKGRGGRSEMIASIVLIVLLVAIQGTSTRWMRAGMDTSSLAQLAQSFGSIINTAYRYLFYFSWQSHLFSAQWIFVDSIGFLLFTSMLIVVMLITCANSFHLVIFRSQGTPPKAKRTVAGAHTAESVLFRQRSHSVALLSKEFSIVNSSSAFMLELYGEAGVPVILIAVYAVSGTLGDFSALLKSLSLWQGFPLVVCAILLLMSTVSMMSSTSVSREGSNFELSRLLPIPASTQVKAKLLAHLLLFFIPYCIYAAASLIYFRLSWTHVLWMIPLGFLIITSSACLGLTIDYHQPRLSWKLPQQAVKQNMNGMIGMGLSLTQIAVVAGFGALSLIVFGLSAWITGMLLILPAFGLLYLSSRLVLREASSQLGPQ